MLSRTGGEVYMVYMVKGEVYMVVKGEVYMINHDMNRQASCATDQHVKTTTLGALTWTVAKSNPSKS